MAGGGFTDAGDLKRAHLYEYRITSYFLIACMVAAMGGSLFGYDLGVSGQFLIVVCSFPLISNYSLTIHFHSGFVLFLHVVSLQKCC